MYALEHPQAKIVKDLSCMGVESLTSQLWLRHTVCDVLLISAGLHMVEFKPKAHYFVIEVGARFYEFNVQVLRSLPRSGLS